MNRSNYQGRGRGYILLLTLVLLGMVAAGLAAVARRSHQATLDANRKERALQREWLSVSAESLLPGAETILTLATQNAFPASGGLVLDYELGHHRVSLTLSDEQAKANLNALWERSDPAVVRATAQTLVASIGSAEQLELRPLGEFEAVAAGSRTDWPVFGIYEQLIPPEVLRQELGASEDEPSATDAITLWGDGRLRVERAEPAVLHAVLFPLLSPSQIERLAVALRDSASPPDDSPDGANAAITITGGDLDLTDRQRELLPSLITAESKCFSVRLRFDNSRRVRTTFAVQEQSSKHKNRSTTRFAW